MKRFLLFAAIGALACVPALAQPELSKPKAEVPPPPANMSCDDLMTNAELKLQTVIDADKKSVAMGHMNAAQEAIEKNDPDGCKAQVQQALDAVN